jgi:hypothetical protein
MSNTREPTDTFSGRSLTFIKNVTLDGIFIDLSRCSARIKQSLSISITLPMSSLLRVSVLLLSLCFAHPALASTAVSGTLTGNTTWTKADSPYVVSNVTIPAGTTLTIDPGVVVKMSARVFFYVFGTVNAQGTAAEPIIFTAITDDSVGGDSNGDQGATLPSVGDWLSLYFLEGSQGTFVNTEIRYGGASNGATPMGALHNQGGSIVLTDCILTDALNYPLAQDSGMTTLTTSTIERGGSGLRMTDGVFALSGNTFTDTLISIDPRVDFINHGNNTGTKGFSFGGQTAANLSGTMTHDQTWVPDGLPYVVADTLTVPALHSLTILPGTTVHSMKSTRNKKEHQDDIISHRTESAHESEL